MTSVVNVVILLLHLALSVVGVAALEAGGAPPTLARDLITMVKVCNNGARCPANVDPIALPNGAAEIRAATAEGGRPIHQLVTSQEKGSADVASCAMTRDIEIRCSAPFELRDRRVCWKICKKYANNSSFGRDPKEMAMNDPFSIWQAAIPPAEKQLRTLIVSFPPPRIDQRGFRPALVVISLLCFCGLWCPTRRRSGRASLLAICVAFASLEPALSSSPIHFHQEGRAALERRVLQEGGDLTDHPCWTEPASNMATATVIDCRNKGLKGTIPSLSAFTELEELYLGGNQLQSTIPAVGALTALTNLYLNDNQLRGTIPTVEALTALTNLYLDDNILRGTIPPLSALTALKWMYLNDNQLQGAIPQLDYSTALERLYLGNNQLRGTIPPLSATSKLDRLDLHVNQLQGTIPPLSALAHLTALDLHDNQLQGYIPPLSAVTALTALDLSNNSLSGALADVSNLNLLDTLNINHNRLLGSSDVECNDSPSSSTNVFLAAETAPQSIAVGLYTEIKITMANDYEKREGRPVFRSTTKCRRASYLYYTYVSGDKDNGRWYISSTPGLIISMTEEVLYVESTEEHPLNIPPFAQWKLLLKNAVGLQDADIALSCSAADDCAPGSFFVSSLEYLLPWLTKAVGLPVCVRCSSGQTSQGSGKPCVECMKGKYCLEGVVNACPAGKYGNAKGLGTPDCAGDCVGGDFCPPNSTLPRVCRAGFYCSDSTAELQCASGAVSSKGATKCEECTKGTRANDNQTLCEPCKLGEWAARASSKCTACPGGRYGGSQELGSASECTDCDPGKFSDGNAACELCQAGKYSNANLSVCEACPEGRYSASVGLGNVVECMPCVPGRFGIYQAEGAMSFEEGCELCKPGFVSKIGATVCTSCDVGTWQNATDCVACPAGRFGNRTGLSDDTCDGDCPPGTHSYRYATKCLACEIGKHAPISGLEDCITCDGLLGLTSLLGAVECVCDKGKYRDANGNCTVCSDGVVCDSIGSDIATLELRRNYWRPDYISDEIIDCPDDGACLGGVNATCATGNEGVLCAICSDGFYRPTAFAACTGCNDDSTEAAVVAVVIGVAMVLGLVALITINRRVPHGLLRPAIDLVQRFSVMMLFNAPFPDALVKFGRVLSALSFSLEVVALGCVGIVTNFYVTFGTTVGLIALIVCSMFLPLLRIKIARGWTVAETLEADAASAVFRDVFVVVLLVHPGVSGMAMQFFRCREVGGVSYLMADYSLECFDSKWWSFLPFVVFVLVAFSFGVPLGIFYVLRKRAAELYDDEGEPVNGMFTARALDILYAMYRKEAYWYESVQMVFKLALWSAVVFFDYNSEMQLATALVVNVIQLCIYIELKPMRGPDAKMLNAMQAAGLVLTTYLNFGGLAMNYLAVAREIAELKEEAEDVIAGYDDKISVIQWIMNVLTFGLVFSIVGVGLKRAFTTIKNISRAEVRAHIARKRSAAAATLPPVLRRCICPRDNGSQAVAAVSNPVATTSHSTVKLQMTARPSR